jgi:plastocyanin
MKQPPVPGLYRVRTSDPILDPDPPRAIVYLEREDGAASPPVGESVVTVSQHGYQFRPGVTAVPVGSQVSFPNLDNEFHSVFSYSQIKRFDLGRYRKDEDSPPVVFDEPGVVRVYCEIHKHMRSLLLVLDTPWFVATDSEGRFVLSDIAPGDYRIRAFLPSERTLESQVTVTADEIVRIDLGEDP